MHRAAVQQGLVAEQAPFVMCDCMDFGTDDAATITELLGDGTQGECSRRQPGESCFYIRYSSCQ